MKFWSRRTLEDFKWPCGRLRLGSSLCRYNKPLATPFMIFSRVGHSSPGLPGARRAVEINKNKTHVKVLMDEKERKNPLKKCR